MGNWKTRSDDEIAWASKPGNRGKTYPGDEMARKELDRDKAAGENNMSIVRKFLFGKSDERKRDVENAVNERRDTGKPIKLEPYVKPAPNDFVPLGMSYNEFKNQKDEPPVSLDVGADSMAQGQTVKKGGIIKAKKMSSGGSASSRGDGIAQRGKTKGRMR